MSTTHNNFKKTKLALLKIGHDTNRQSIINLSITAP